MRAAQMLQEGQNSFKASKPPPLQGCVVLNSFVINDANFTYIIIIRDHYQVM